MLKKLFGLGPKDPISSWSHPCLGEVKWNPELNSWVGVIHNISFTLPYHPSGEPNTHLAHYAESLVGNPELFNSILIDARNDALRNFSEFLKEEIQNLQPSCLNFFSKQKEFFLTIEMQGGAPERPWTIKYRGIECQGMNFK